MIVLTDKEGREREARADGWQNLITGIGAANGRTGGIEHARENPKDASVLAGLFDGDSLARRICAEPAKDMFRRGLRVAIEGAADLEDAITDRLETLHSARHLTRAVAMQRALGKAAVLMFVDDGRPFSDPVQDSAIKAVRWLRSYDCRHLSVVSIETDPSSMRFGQPSQYRLNLQQPGRAVEPILVHPDRLLVFADSLIAADDSNWSADACVSVLGNAYKEVRDAGYAWAAVVEALDQFSIPVWGIGGLRQVLAKEGEGILSARFAIHNMSKSVARAVIRDKDNEDFDFRSMSFGGIPEILDRIMQRLSAATGIPATKLLGQSPAGMNATGESDLRNYYDLVEAERQQETVPQIEQLIRLLFLEREGAARAEPEAWRVEFPPLWQPTESEVRDNELKAMNMLAMGVNTGVLLEEEARSAIGENGAIRSIELDDGLFTEELDRDSEPSPAEPAEPPTPPEPEATEEDPEGPSPEAP